MKLLQRSFLCIETKLEGALKQKIVYLLKPNCFLHFLNQSSTHNDYDIII